ncbi:PREDICTED: gastrula zinc finger protein XlCGF7.1-like [Thamnophis sirtalis]|uniref:Gastrula zinc finger protein XlCGF7.1-like n=1 Tax=Thamnophis sirtalis TaxID=35019 RepID=A0A6I9XC22_9SAUR|nr:PREDICTED: gastrula zinc finger protein XlCGF7.1-like [Thamnophis sirtalis]
MDGTDQEPVAGRTRQRSPPEEKPFPFPAWEESSGDENGLVIHSQVEEEEHKCAMCGESFSQPLGLLRHQKQQHAGERAFVCPECGRGFSLKHNLIIHQRIHTGEKPFGCSVCGKRFSLKQNLLTHQRVHGGPARRPFACPVCGKHFREERLLTAHQKRDDCEQQQQGSLEDQTGPVDEEGEEDFARRRLRVKHQEKPPQTRAAFSRRGSGKPLGGRSGRAGSPRTRQAKEETPKVPKPRLRREDAPFQCVTCKKNFSQKGNLAAHRRSHRERESLS